MKSRKWNSLEQSVFILKITRDDNHNTKIHANMIQNTHSLNDTVQLAKNY